jgi:hypothetical protein
MTDTSNSNIGITAGMWELPGGRIDPQETPAEAALREWQEETGLEFPDGELAAEWTTPDGSYVAYVWEIDSEAMLPPSANGDRNEPTHWWDIEHIVGNPAIRGKVRALPLESLLSQANTAIHKVAKESGNPQALIDWYNAGADGQIEWGSEGDFNACVAVAGQYIDDPEGFCQLRHIDAVGGPAGSEGKKGAEDRERNARGEFTSGDALTDKVIEASKDNLGSDSRVEWVPIEQIDRMKEADRASSDPTEAFGESRATIDGLKESIKTEGFREPLVVQYGSRDRYAYLGEGNHRLAAAKELGLTHVPVRVNKYGPELEGHKGAVQVPGYKTDPEDPYNHVPGDMKPSDIGLDTLQGAKKATDYEHLISDRKGEPDDEDLYNRVKAEAAKKFEVFPSAVASGWIVQEYKRRGGTYSKPAEKAAEDTFTPPQSVRDAAQRALGWLKEGKQGQGFTDTGRKRASDLANGHAVSYTTVKRMKAFFDRHQPDKKATGFNAGEDRYPTPGRVAWDAWGGDAGYSWATGIVERTEAKKSQADDVRNLLGRDAYPDDKAFVLGVDGVQQVALDYFGQPRIPLADGEALVIPETPLELFLSDSPYGLADSGGILTVEQESAIYEALGAKAVITEHIVFKEFDESSHPRVPAGEEGAGEFEGDNGGKTKKPRDTRSRSSVKTDTSMAFRHAKIFGTPTYVPMLSYRFKKVEQIAADKILAAPVPTKADIERNRELIARSKRQGGDLRGGSAARHASVAKLLRDFGDGETCPCVHCGVVIDKRTCTRDKIYTAEEGGRYIYENLLPSCEFCNKSRNDAPIWGQRLGKLAARLRNK